MKGLILETTNTATPFSQEDAFAGSNNSPAPVGIEKIPENNGVIDAVINVAKQTKDMLIDESKTLAPDVADTFRESSNRLNSDKRIISAIPNSYLYFGIVTLLGYVVVKKYM